MREKYDTRLRDNQRNVAHVRRLSKARDSLMSTEMKKERRKKIKKEMSLQDIETGEISETGDYKYPKTKMKRQSTISTSQPSSSSSNTSSISSDTNKSTKTDTTTKKKQSTGNFICNRSTCICNGPFDCEVVSLYIFRISCGQSFSNS